MDTLSFEITDSPSAGRTFPHYKGQGFVVPISTAVVRGGPDDR
jgi:hypothetical protein